MSDADLSLIQEAAAQDAQDSLHLTHRLAPAEETRKRIVDALTEGKSHGQSKGALILLGGGPVAGKSTYLERIQYAANEASMGERVIALNPSMLKWQIPEYAVLAKLYDESNPLRAKALEAGVMPDQLHAIGVKLFNLFEKEKEALLQDCVAKLTAQGYIVVLEHHMDDPVAVEGLFNAAHANHVQTALIAPDISVENFFARGREREAATGKWLMPHAALSHHAAFEQSWPDYMKQADIAIRLDNNRGPGEDRISAIHSKGKLHVFDAAAYQASRSKATLTWDSTIPENALAAEHIESTGPHFRWNSNEHVQPAEILEQSALDGDLKYLIQSVEVPARKPVFAIDRHYSGYDHRPFDYSTKDAEQVQGNLRHSRYGQSLTKLNPRDYSQAEKDRLYTCEFADHALAAGDISAPKDRTVLWSGGYIPGHPLGYGMGRIAAEHWMAQKNHAIEHEGKPYHEVKEQLYHTVAMTEAGFSVLNPMWDDATVPNETKWAVTPTYIMGFARTARGEITLNVDDTDIDSFFRKNELEVIMENPNITSVRVVRFDPAGKNGEMQEIVYPDRPSWYEDQKDQWVDSIMTRYKLALHMDDGSEAAKKLLTRMEGALAEELYESYKHYTQGNPLLLMATNAQIDASKARESIRLGKLAHVLGEHPTILDNDKIYNGPTRIALQKLCNDSAIFNER